MKNILAENMRRFGTKNLNENLNDYVEIDTNNLVRDLEVVYDEIQQDIKRANADLAYATDGTRDSFVRNIADRNQPNSWPTWLKSQFHKTTTVQGPSQGQPQTQTTTTSPAADKDVVTLAKEYTDQLGGGKVKDSVKMSIASALVPNTTKK